MTGTSIVNPDWSHFARIALEEDRATHDVTTALLGDAADRTAHGTFIAEESFVLAGMPLARAVFMELGDVDFKSPVDEGTWVKAGDAIAHVTGSFRVLLAGERVALNYLQRLCGIATQTGRVVAAVRDHDVHITDTRKTTPGLRAIEKYAVRIAGGVNHRFSLEDAVLWKDNHWALLSSSGETLKDVLSRKTSSVVVQVEIENVEQLKEVVAAGVTSVLIDNQSPATISRWAQMLGSGVTIEASGGITPERAQAYAAAGVNRISMGSLTHSAKGVEMKFEIVAAGR